MGDIHAGKPLMKCKNVGAAALFSPICDAV
jgi:hypothetical protein